MSGCGEEEMPLLTVAMPVFNGGIHLRPALLSIMKQTFRRWELLLIDDGSTDSSVINVMDIIDHRVRVIRDGKNRGLAARLNEAIDLAQGRYFARMDQDDISHPERFERQIESLSADSRLDLLGTQCVTISERSEMLGLFSAAESHQAICARPWLGFYLPHPTWMGRTEWFRKHRYATPGPYCCEDQELLLRTYDVSRFSVLPKRLLAYRLRDQVSWEKAWRTRTTLYKIQLSRFLAAKHYSYATLATMALLARAGLDSYRLLKQVLPRVAGDRSKVSEISQDDLVSWRRWLALLENQVGPE